MYLGANRAYLFLAPFVSAQKDLYRIRRPFRIASHITVYALKKFDGSQRSVARTKQLFNIGS